MFFTQNPYPELQNAFKNQELKIYYQPQFNTHTSMFEGVEAVLRWHHPERGILLPHQFMPETAEQKKILNRISRWVLKTVCQQIKLWNDKGLQNLKVAVNVTGEQFQQSRFVDFIILTLHKYHVKPATLELELSETINFETHIQIIPMLKRLYDHGISIALDDFDTKLSSFNYLKVIPLHRIKIDKKLIENIHNNKEDAEVVITIINLAHSMNVSVVAEGVETIHQLDLLIANKCNEIQGFYFSEPLPEEQLQIFLASRAVPKPA